MSRREDNLKLLAEMGIQMDPNAPPSPPPQAPPDPEAEDQGLPPHDDPEQQLAPEPPAPAPKKNPDEKHDWEKRKADAQEAQRALSRLQKQLDDKEKALESRFQALDERERKIDEKLALLESPKNQTPKQTGNGDESEVLKALRADYPELVAAIEEMVNPVKRTVEEDRAERKRQAEEAEKRAEEKRKRDEAAALKAQEDHGEKVLAEVKKEFLKLHRKDAIQVAESPEFSEWISSLPDQISNSYADVIVNTYRYKATDALFVLNQFMEATRRQTPRPDQAPSIRPTGAPAPTNGSMALTPLSNEELLGIEGLMRRAKNNEERAILTKRLALSYETQT